ncbi:MAG TPA: sensor histidine kinase [Bacillota bacterium]|nr:sensor histidine kinase [Bacillota bacterium]
MDKGNDLDFSILDSVLKKAITAVESSKEQIFDIAEEARDESYSIQQELEKIKREVSEIIFQTDTLDRQFRLSRARLVEVSSNFRKYTEEDVRQAYEKSSQLQVDLLMSREKEMNLRKRRDDLDRRLRNLANTIEKAENMMTQIGVVLGYLTGDLGEFCVALESAQQRQMLGLQVIQTQEEERKRVARDIHDGPAQSMANLMIRTEIAEKMLERGLIEDVRKELVELKETVRNTLADVRKIIFDLRPMALDDLGLVPTLRKYLEDFGNRYQMETELITMGKEVRFEPMVEVVIFRMVQEGLNNAGKHSKAKNIQIKIEYLPERTTVVVRDDGVGFEHQDRTDRPHFGIMGMTERMKLIDGTLNIHSVIGTGTRLVFTIPVNR